MSISARSLLEELGTGDSFFVGNVEVRRARNVKERGLGLEDAESHVEDASNGYCDSD